MTNNTYRYTRLILMVLLLSPLGLGASGEGIRISTRSVAVRHDSLFLDLEMGLGAVRVSSERAYIFTPSLYNEGKRVELPPVIVSGARRYRFDIREHALSREKEPQEPYRVLLPGRKNPSADVRYRVGIPYAAWMRQAALVLKQECKDCCVMTLLSVDTLTRNISLKQAGRIEEVPEENEIVAEPVIVGGTPLIPMAQAPVAVAPAAVAPAAVAPCLPVVTQSVPLTGGMLAGYLPMVSYLTPDTHEKVKQRIVGTTLYIDYPVNQFEVDLDYKNNRREVDKADSLLTPVLSNGFTVIERIRIRGYASPDGNYKDNEILSSRRSRLFMHYISDAYSIPEKLFDVSWVAEDWEGTRDLLSRTRPPYYEESICVIDTYGIFNGREKRLMDLRGGVPYKQMLRELFPLLRRIELVVQYNVRNVDRAEAMDLVYTHPELLSLDEIYDVARYYRPGTEQYREIYEIAAFHFPSDVVANVNAASAVMLTGDLISAWDYLRKVEDSPKAWNNMGVLTLMEGNPEGAATWFRKAVGVEPQKARANLQVAEAMVRQKSVKTVRSK